MTSPRVGRAALTLLGLVLAGCVQATIAPPGPPLAGPIIDLALAFPDAMLRPPATTLVERQVVEVPGGKGSERLAIACHPPGSATFKVALGATATLTTTLVRPGDQVEKGSDGVTFQVRLRPEHGRETMLLDRFVAPADPDRIPVALDLASYAGQTVVLTLATGFGPKGNGSYDGALFEAPRIRQQGKGSAGLARRILVTIDTLRQDRLSCDGSPTVLTPALDRLSRRGRIFASVLAQCNATTPSHAVLLTGRAPIRTGVYGTETPLPADVETLAEAFHAQGHRTGAVISVAHLKPEMSGLGRGFEDFFACREMRQAADATDLALGWISRHREESFFLWVHYFDPHTNYEPPEPWRALVPPSSTPGPSIPSRVDSEPDAIFPEPARDWLKDVSDLALPEAWYDGEVAYASHEIGRLVRALDAWEMLPSTTLVLTADHGESLGEHGIYYGHAGLFEPEVRVPLMVLAPDLAPAVVRRPVAHLDVFPTLAGRPPKGGDDGLSLAGDGPWDRTLYAFHAHRESVMVTRSDRKVIVPWVRPFFAKNKIPYRFDLAHDPLEGTILADDADLAPLEEEARRLTSSARCPASIPVSQEEQERLRSLGYLAPSPSANGCK